MTIKGTISGAKTILIVDDVPENLLLLGEVLQPEYRVLAANSGQTALKVAGSDPRPDLILLDVMMPGMDGYQVLEKLQMQKDLQHIPVIFITALGAAEDEEKGLELGAVDYISKPFSPAVVKARVKTHLELKASRDRLASHNRWLEGEVNHQVQENHLIRDLSVRALACLAEIRDQETGFHIARTQAYVEILANRLSDHPRFREALKGSKLEEIVRAAPLHDIGKIGIPDSILLKPGSLTSEEYEVMKTHSEIGSYAIDNAIEQALAGVKEYNSEQAQEAVSFLHIASEIARYHHEKWDGSGYPAGLSGNDIPVSARLMALADVFDALTSHRVYKDAMEIDETLHIIASGRGTHFDPDVVDAFMACRDQFIAISHTLREKCSI
ncbi:response regulator [Marinobacterium sediminicola]|uniref:Two-component system response regulator n=1 Tax=Marinobacterium sediminicola TaxID=518898 RepID=A0ABY1RYZ2_9GAMM|nr:two-component system response regulator [Marinobacterium sediminicola]ULG67999.1 two-component system response regulator [Marinobacterium sediminicola]SMR73491.1 putative two-component system response regulator [Marinobacterium sediminicola]